MDKSLEFASADRFRRAYNDLVAYAAGKFGLSVHVRDVPDPFTGDLDGAGVFIDYDLEPADALFIAAHLIGHTIQWNISDAARQIGMLAVSVPCADEALLARLEAYERDAAALSLQVLHDAGISDLDQWFCEYVECDVRFLLDFYRTGDRKDPLSFWISPVPAVVPAPIPRFSLRHWMSGRNTGVVILSRPEI